MVNLKCTGNKFGSDVFVKTNYKIKFCDNQCTITVKYFTIPDSDVIVNTQVPVEWGNIWVS